MDFRITVREMFQGRWGVVALLWLSYTLYQADKQIYSVVLPPLRADLHLTGYETGLVATLFTIVVALVSPLAGALGDRFPKSTILTAAIALWSLGTLGTGFAGGFVSLVVLRAILTSGGEAFYPPIAHALLAGHHTTTRAFAISIHQTAQYFGPIASGFAAGWIAERYGWRIGFVWFGVLGLALSALFSWRLRDAAGMPLEQRGLVTGFRQSLAIPAVRRIGYSFAAVLFVTLGYQTFAPTLFGRQFGLSLSEAGFYTALAGNGAAMLGALVGGALSDAAARRGVSRFVPQAASLALAAPLLVVLGQAEQLYLALGALAGIGFFRGIYEGTIAVALYDFVRPEHRSSAASLVLLIANLLAAPSSALLGWISDRAPLGNSISAMSLSFLLAAFILFRSRRLA
jgi:MFS family permease